MQFADCVSILWRGLLVGLLLIDWQVAVVTAALFAIAYALVGLSSRRQLRDNGKRIAVELIGFKRCRKVLVLFQTCFSMEPSPVI